MDESGWTSRLTNLFLRALARRSRGLRTLLRPAAEQKPAFELSYLRTGPRGRTPVLVIPGGPGLSSTLPYGGFRRLARRHGLDLIMVEHRGVGLSRHSVDGLDLPADAIWVNEVVDDLAAVLVTEGIDQAVIVGASYGSYLAAGIGVRHPQLVAAMVLDSPMLSTGDDRREERRAIRAVMTPPEPTPISADIARLVADGINADDLLFAARTVYEAAGAPLLRRFLDQLAEGAAVLTWQLLVGALSREATSLHPIACINEFDLVGTLAFRELDYGSAPDGQPFDPAMAYAKLAERFPRFVGEPFDLRQAMPDFDWPTVVLSGRHDLRTVPAIARQISELLPQGRLVELDNGHSALESHPEALLQVIGELLQADRADQGLRLASGPQSTLDELPRKGLAAQLPHLIAGLLTVDLVVSRVRRSLRAVRYGWRRVRGSRHRSFR